MILPALCSLFAIRFLLCSDALSWPKSRRNQLQLSAVHPTDNVVMTKITSVDALGLKQGEIDALFVNTKSLESYYSRKPDCFRRAAGALRIRCGELGMNEDERVKAAISMTLCELATANHHFSPLECADFSPESLQLDTPRGSQGRCVEALSRSAQFWSSYSGYLREIPQLCWAFRRWNDIDTAKDIYRNATVEKIALVHFIMAREKTTNQNLRIWEHHLQEMRDLMAHMRLVSGTVEVVADDINFKVVSRLDNAIQSLQGFIEDSYSRSITRLQFVVDEMSNRHALAMANFLPSLEESLSSHLNIVFDTLHENNQGTLNLANEIHQKWSNLGSEISVMQQSITGLIVSVSQATLTLDSHTRQAQLAHHLQVESTQAVAILTETISRLTSTAHEELEKINGTAVLLRESLMTGTRDRWWKDSLVCIIEMVWRVDPRTFAYLNSLPIIRAGFVLAKCLCYLFQTTFSSLMSVLVVFISSRRYFFKSLTSSADSNGIIYRNGETAHVPHIQPQAPSIIHTRFFSRSSSDPRIHDLYLHSRPVHRMSRIPDRLCMSGSR